MIWRYAKSTSLTRNDRHSICLNPAPYSSYHRTCICIQYHNDLIQWALARPIRKSQL